MDNSNIPVFQGAACPIPLPHDKRIVLGHGSGGRMSKDLIESIFLPYLNSKALSQANDFGRVTLPNSANIEGSLVMSVDSHIVSPLFFPGGDIGRLAVCGTVNDISMSGAIPLALTAGFIIEEGLSIHILEKVAASMQMAATEAEIEFIAGDTKVAEKGKADGLFITTSGIGWLPQGRVIGGEQARPDDVVIVSGTLGDHGIAVLTARGDLGFETSIQSDVAPLNHLIQAIIQAAPHAHVFRDPTRGGLATTLVEIASQSNVCIMLDEKDIPVQPAVRAACEMLGFDPLYIANEGKLIAIVPACEAAAALSAMHSNPYGTMAMRIGEVVPEPKNRVLLRTLIGGTRVLDMLSGEMLPRIC